MKGSVAFGPVLLWTKPASCRFSRETRPDEGGEWLRPRAACRIFEEAHSPARRRKGTAVLDSEGSPWALQRASGVHTSRPHSVSGRQHLVVSLTYGRPLLH